MNLASKIIVSYLGYSSFKHSKKKNTPFNLENYDDKIDHIIKKYDHQELKEVNQKKYQVENLPVHRKIKDKKKCEQLFQQFLKKNNIPKIIPKLLFQYYDQKKIIILNNESNFICYQFHLKHDKHYCLQFQFEVENIYHLEFILCSTDQTQLIHIPFLFAQNQLFFLLNHLQNVGQFTVYILFPKLAQTINIHNFNLKLEEIKQNNQNPIIIYKNNHIEKQIFYNKHNFLKIQNHFIRIPLIH
jgi:hypothetical protein